MDCETKLESQGSHSVVFKFLWPVFSLKIRPFLMVPRDGFVQVLVQEAILVNIDLNDAQVHEQTTHY